MALRTFLALDIDEALREVLAGVQGRVGPQEARIRWVAAENLHVTMNFLGDVAEDRISEVCGAVGEAAAGIEPFGFEVGAVACVPPRGQVRMIWAEVSDPAGRMGALHDQAGRALAGLGFARERRSFKGHITLARVKSCRRAELLRQAVQEQSQADFTPQQAGELVVYSSQLTPGGAVYTPLARLTLGQAVTKKI